MTRTKTSKAYAILVAALFAGVVASALLLTEVFACLEYLVMQPYQCGEWGACNWRHALDPIRAFSYVNVDNPEGMVFAYIIGLSVAVAASKWLQRRLRRIDDVLAARAWRQSRCELRRQAREPEATAARLRTLDRSIAQLQEERVALQARRSPELCQE